MSNFIFVVRVVILWLCPLHGSTETSCNSHSEALIRPGAPSVTSAAYRLHNDRLLLNGTEHRITRETDTTQTLLLLYMTDVTAIQTLASAGHLSFLFH